MNDEDSHIEEIWRYIDGTLQDDVHPREVECKRVPGSGRPIPGGGWACDFDMLFQGAHARITLTVAYATSS